MNLGAPPTADATRSRAVHVAACAGLLAFSLGFVMSATVTGLWLPWYEPLQRRWILAPTAPTGVAMDFFARLGLATLTGLAGGVVGWIVGLRRTLSDAMLRAVIVWAMGMTVLGLFLYAYALGTRVIVTGH